MVTTNHQSPGSWTFCHHCHNCREFCHGRTNKLVKPKWLLSGRSSRHVWQAFLSFHICTWSWWNLQLHRAKSETRVISDWERYDRLHNKQMVDLSGYDLVEPNRKTITTKQTKYTTQNCYSDESPVFVMNPQQSRTYVPHLFCYYAWTVAIPTKNISYYQNNQQSLTA